MTHSSKNDFQPLRVSALALCILGFLGILSSVGVGCGQPSTNPSETKSGTETVASTESTSGGEPVSSTEKPTSSPDDATGNEPGTSSEPGQESSAPDASGPEAQRDATTPPEQKPTAGTNQRPWSPIVLTGSRMLGLQGIVPSELVAFRYDGTQQTWVQIPVQVDERKVEEYYKIYNKVNNCPHNFYLKGPSFRNLVYADKNTHTGADPDPKLDADDEVVVMRKDAGQRVAQFTHPVGTVKGTGVELLIKDPLDNKGDAYVYFFRQDGSLKQDAGKRYVTYKFNLKSGDYKSTYNHCGNKSTASPANAEDTLIETKYYTRHFSDRWISDGFTIKSPVGTGVDILDLHHALFGPGVCGRSVTTFSSHEGAFIANINGPIRAIRSYIGANSGPLVQRQHIFYERVELMTTFLRVHQVNGILNTIDFSEAAKGMIYRNNLNTKGVTIDGKPDAIKAGMLRWETFTGKQGQLLQLLKLNTDLKLNNSSYYLDEAPAKITQCTGDKNSYGQSGSWVKGGIANTDPRRGKPGESVGTFVATNRFSVEGKGLNPALATLRAKQFEQPFQATLASIDEQGRGPACGDQTCDSGETEQNCAIDCSKVKCGDGKCDAGETASGCPKDCKPKTCGDSKCDAGTENLQNCPEDCKPQTNCGDGKCDPFETEQTCPADCKGSNNGNVLTCVRQKCPKDAQACQKNQGCTQIYQCFAKCKSSLQQCLKSCSKGKPANSSKLFQTLATCAQQQKCI